MTQPIQTVQERTFQFSVAIVQFCRKLSANRDYWAVSDQLIRSGTSVGANVREARAAASKKEFAHFYDIALKSANETQYWLELIAATSDHAPQVEITNKLWADLDVICKILGRSLKTMRTGSV